MWLAISSVLVEMFYYQPEFWIRIATRKDIKSYLFAVNPYPELRLLVLSLCGLI